MVRLKALCICPFQEYIVQFEGGLPIFHQLTHKYLCLSVRHPVASRRSRVLAAFGPGRATLPAQVWRGWRHTVVGLWNRISEGLEDFEGRGLPCERTGPEPTRRLRRGASECPDMGLPLTLSHSIAARCHPSHSPDGPLPRMPLTPLNPSRSASGSKQLFVARSRTCTHRTLHHRAFLLHPGQIRPVDGVPRFEVFLHACRQAL